MERRVLGEADVRDLEVRGRYLRRRGFGGYRCEDVDAFLMEVIRSIRDLLGENEGLRAGVSPDQLWSMSPSGRVTPFDVQDARFHHVRFGGYDMRDVDDHLDDLTDVLTSLDQENERLRSASPTSREET